MHQQTFKEVQPTLKGGPAKDGDNQKPRTQRDAVDTGSPNWQAIRILQQASFAPRSVNFGARLGSDKVKEVFDWTTRNDGGAGLLTATYLGDNPGVSTSKFIENAGDAPRTDCKQLSAARRYDANRQAPRAKKKEKSVDFHRVITVRMTDWHIL